MSSEKSSQTKKVNWKSIGLALLAVTAGKIAFSAFSPRSTSHWESDPNFIPIEDVRPPKLGPIVLIDSLGDGTFIVDGERMTTEELLVNLPELRAKSPQISLYQAFAFKPDPTIPETVRKLIAISSKFENRSAEQAQALNP